MDPKPDEIRTHCQLWVQEKKPLKDLRWDPADYVWKDTIQNESKQRFFFQYTVKIGRHILARERQREPVAATFWLSQGISKQFILKFW